MNPWITAALLGTEKRSIPALGNNLVDQLVQQSLASEDGPAEQLLLREGIRSIMQRAGVRPQPFQATTTESLQDLLDEPDPHITHLLERLLGTSAYHALIPEACQLMQNRNWHIPSRLVPWVLSLKDRGLRTLLRPLIDRRGEWLARLNPEWSWAIETSVPTTEVLQLQWKEGTRTERLSALEQMFSCQPATARQWIRETFSTERADEKSRLLDTLLPWINDEDATWLSDLMSDRSLKVKQSAEQGLLALPISDWRAKQIELADQYVQIQGTNENPQWNISFPAQVKETGQTAWVELLFSAVPIVYWSNRHPALPDPLIQSARMERMGDAMLQGWTRAALSTDECVFQLRHPTATEETNLLEWRIALMRAWFKTLKNEASKQISSNSIVSIASRLPVPELERICRDLLGAHIDIAILLAHQLPTPWSTSFRDTILQETVLRMNGSDHRRLQEWLPLFALLAQTVEADSLNNLRAIVNNEFGWVPTPRTGSVERQWVEIANWIELRHHLNNDFRENAI